MKCPIKIKYVYSSVIGLLLVSAAYGQINISGKVVDAKGDQPLTGASVYINNCTIATYTDAQGEFHFESVHLPNTELIVFAPGYELVAYHLNPAQIAGKRIVFKLEQAAMPLLKRLELSPANKKLYMKVFLENLLGVSEEASKCQLLNGETIYFVQGEKKNSFSVLADTGLVVINEMLGYRLKINLEDFTYDYLTGQSSISGYMYFQEMAPSNKVNNNRKECYNGSSLHFYRSLVSHRLYEQGFGVFLLKNTSNEVIAKPQEPIYLLPAPGKTTAEPLSADRILYIDSSNKLSIRISGKLVVQYNKNTVEKKFLVHHGYLTDQPGNATETLVQIKSPVEINYFGVLSDYHAFEYSGYWMYEKIGNTLPFDYTLQ